MTDVDAENPLFAATLDMIHRTGAIEFQIRYDDDPEPTVWVAAGKWPNTKGGLSWQAAGGMTPWEALWRLAEICVDGGKCNHCGKPTGIDASPPDELLDDVGQFICFYRYDPELATFRRSCEGTTEAAE